MATEFALTHTATEPSQIIHSGSLVSLANWVNVSWFYPDNFEPKEVIETSRSFVVLGQHLVYKFQKPTTTERRAAFCEQWKRACEEIFDNQPSAHGLYHGLRLLKWVDEEPRWYKDVFHKNLNPTRPPREGDHVVIVMRRIPSSAQFSYNIRRPRTLSEDRIHAIADSLARLHQRQAGYSTSALVDPIDPLTPFSGRKFLQKSARFYYLLF